MDKREDGIAVDLPALLDAEVHSTFLLAYAQAVHASAIYYLNLHRNVLLGVPRIKQSIEQGFSPEMIGTLLDDVKGLEELLRSVGGKVRDMALGQAVVQVATQYAVASLREGHLNLDSVRLQRMQVLKQEIIAKGKGSSASGGAGFIFPAIDYSSLFTFVEGEKQNGSLQGDPAWELERTRKKTPSWRGSLQINLKRLDILFKRTADGIDWDSVTAIDSVILQALPAPDLISSILINQESSSARLSAGPLPAGHKAMRPIDAEEEGSLTRLGVLFRTDILKAHKKKANDEFSRGRYEEAEVLYAQAMKAGSNDASFALNRAAALLKLNRCEEAVACASVALTQLDKAESAMPTKEGHQPQSQQQHSDRTTPMHLASREELKTLRWKAFVRRGKARKAMLPLIRAEGIPHTDDNKQSTSLATLLTAAEADFAAAIRIDPDDEVPKRELASLVGLEGGGGTL